MEEVRILAIGTGGVVSSCIRSRPRFYIYPCPLKMIHDDVLASTTTSSSQSQDVAASVEHLERCALSPIPPLSLTPRVKRGQNKYLGADLDSNALGPQDLSQRHTCIYVLCIQGSVYRDLSRCPPEFIFVGQHCSNYMDAHSTSQVFLCAWYKDFCCHPMDRCVDV